MKHLIDFLKWVIYHSLGSRFNEKPSAIFMLIVLFLIAFWLTVFLIGFLVYTGLLYYVFLLIPIGIVVWAVYDYRKSK